MLNISTGYKGHGGWMRIGVGMLLAGTVLAVGCILDRHGPTAADKGTAPATPATMTARWMAGFDLGLEIVPPETLSATIERVNIVITPEGVGEAAVFHGSGVPAEDGRVKIIVPAAVLAGAGPWAVSAVAMVAGRDVTVPLTFMPVRLDTRADELAPQLVKPNGSGTIELSDLDFVIRVPVVDTATRYVVQVATDADFTDLRADWELAGNQAVLSVPDLPILTDGAYYWRAFGGATYPAQVRVSRPVTGRFQVHAGCRDHDGTAWAVRVVEADIRCGRRNRHDNTANVLGPPDARQLGDDRFSGITSLGVNGHVTLEMGRCPRDGPGPDIRVFQVVSYEGVEVQVAFNLKGPWYSLGVKPCSERSGYFARKCDFDLGSAGLKLARYVRVIDRIETTHPGRRSCAANYNATPGADIDAVQLLN